MIKNICITCILKLLCILPLFAARALGSAVGNLMWLCRDRNYRVTLKNLRLCMPELNDEQLRKMARGSLVETAKTAAEAAAIWYRDWAWLKTKIVAVEGEDILRSELAQGKGLIVLAPHLGNWEVVAPYLASIAPLTAMYKPFSNLTLDQLVFCGRSKCNINMAPTNLKGVSMLLKALKSGTIVGILPDQVPETSSGAEAIPFFGNPAMTMSLVHSLISRTGCRVVAVFAMRVKNGYKLITLPAAAEIYSADVHESLRGLNMSVEACVRLAPEQYQWEYNRFKCLTKEVQTKSSASCCP